MNRNKYQTKNRVDPLPISPTPSQADDLRRDYNEFPVRRNNRRGASLNRKNEQNSNYIMYKIEAARRNSLPDSSGPKFMMYKIEAAPADSVPYKGPQFKLFKIETTKQEIEASDQRPSFKLFKIERTDEPPEKIIPPKSEQTPPPNREPTPPPKKLENAPEKKAAPKPREPSPIPEPPEPRRAIARTLPRAAAAALAPKSRPVNHRTLESINRSMLKYRF